MLSILVHVPFPFNFTEHALIFVLPRSIARNVPVSLPLGREVTSSSTSFDNCAA